MKDYYPNIKYFYTVYKLFTTWSFYLTSGVGLNLYVTKQTPREHPIYCISLSLYFSVSFRMYQKRPLNPPLDPKVTSKNFFFKQVSTDINV